eukprot:scaffold62048_cov31-Attheya_sp.AAC.3
MFLIVVCPSSAVSSSLPPTDLTAQTARPRSPSFLSPRRDARWRSSDCHIIVGSRRVLIERRLQPRTAEVYHILFY